MSFTIVQATGATSDGTSVAKAFSSNVAVGNLITVTGSRFTPSLDDFVAGDCTQSAGTATLGTITLDKVINRNTSGSNYLVTGTWSAVVTGAGSLTMQVGNGVAGSAHNIGIVEAHSDATTSFAVEATASGSSAAPPDPSTGNATSAGAALFIAGTTISASNVISITEDAGYNLVYEENNGALHLNSSAIYQIVGSGTTDNAGWTTGVNPITNWAATLVVYKELLGTQNALAWIQA